jgi:hypothetical protein
VKIRRVSFVRVHSKQKAQGFVPVFPTLQASRSEVPPADRIDSHAEGGAGEAPLYTRRFRVPGDVAQLGEHLLCKQGVSGSSPLISTSTLTTE